MKCGVIDIESTSLEAIGAGVMLMAVIKPLGGSAVSLRADKLGCTLGKEKRLISAIAKHVAQLDVLIGHNLIKFDWPFIRSKATVFGVSLKQPYPLGYDTMQAFRRIGFRTKMTRYGKPTASLAMIVDFFGLDQMKTSIYPRAHWESVWGNSRARSNAMKELEQHCISDVEMTERIFYKIFENDSNAALRRLR